MRVFRLPAASRHAAAVISALPLGIAWAAGLIGTANAAVIPYSHAGTPNTAVYQFTASGAGDVIAYFAGSGAAYDETVGLYVNGVLTSAGFGLDDHASAIGQAFDFGSAAAGSALVFAIRVTTLDDRIVYSNPALNGGFDVNGGKGHQHIYSTAYSAASGLLPAGIPSGAYIGFEDETFPSSDFNYADETYVVTGVTYAAAVPEPATLAVVGAGLAGLAALRRRRG